MEKKWVSLKKLKKIHPYHKKDTKYISIEWNAGDLSVKIYFEFPVKFYTLLLK